MKKKEVEEEEKTKN